MKHYFLDANVVVDYLLRREPFWYDAATLMQAGLRRQATLYVSSLTFATAFYLLRKQLGGPETRQLIGLFERLVTVVAVDAVVVRLAVAGPFADFEDGLQHYAAVAEPSTTAIVTRNQRDFAGSALPVLSPSQALFELAA